MSKLKELKRRIEELENKIYDMESTYSSPDGKYKYPVRGHPRWKGQDGNPYLPLDENGNMRKGYVG